MVRANHFRLFTYPVGLLLTAFLLLSVLTSCRQSAGGAPIDANGKDGAPDVQMTLAANPEPKVVGPLSWKITLLDSAGAPIEGAAIEIRGDMNHAGMKPVVATTTEEGNGIYTADFEWTMAGDWILTVTATLPDGRVKTGVYDYAVGVK